MALRIVSLNAWGGSIHAPLIDYLANVDADVFCLQEVVRSAADTPGWLEYRDGGVVLPQRAHLYDEIAAVFPGHDGFFCPFARGDLFHGEAVFPTEFGIATFVRKSHAIIGQAVDFIHGGFSSNGWGEHPRSRNAHCIRLFDHAGGFSLTIAQLHGLRDPAGKGDIPARHAQADALVELIERVWPGDERLVVCGDFNVLPDSITFEKLGRLGLNDLVTGRGFTDTRTSLYPKDGRFADYMLVTPEVVVERFEVVEQPEVSDHRALLIELA
ncbi:endonuclease/exonuclease/phosphatase family protein [Rhizobium viscosum]|uniref:Endonuclease/exonuclease/phosphatase family metal-dependent hydrolase n=1 Tax=Rhizobium viscosum TaxID=1673 RepID=A0ABR9IK91_RHIVS|nr:endonuclease/exonuclease/phosphatase family protein [Rhizobium viscosum]MBE1503597.1 endonuclease/exonuclease/phosphatase family metal-dependent hydrolase [Rhizobium viscosum]